MAIPVQTIEYTYKVEITLKRAKLLGTKVLWQDSIGKLGHIKDAKGQARI